MSEIVESPTNHLRIVRLNIVHSVVGNDYSGYRVAELPAEAKEVDRLQQLWQVTSDGDLISKEWRDVPIVTD